MKSSPKTALIITAIIAIVILIIAALTSTGSDVATNSTPVAPVEQAPVDTGASLTLVDPIAGTVQVGQVQRIKWTSSNYSSPTVSINLLRQVSTDPVRFELIRTVAAFTQNDGEAVWVPSKTEVGQNIVIEIACTISNESCKASRSIAPIAVVDAGRNSNTASVYSAFEQSQNK